MKNWKIQPKDIFDASPIIPVMVIDRLEDAIPMAQALLDGGLSVFEITLRTPVALQAINDIAMKFPQAYVGAGTVTSVELYDAAVKAGAQFVISPGMTAELLTHARQGSVPLIPGTSTPSEMMTAIQAGYTYLKFFPAEANGGVKALAAISAPLPQIKFCPTGGISPENVKDYINLKSVSTVGGTWMLPKANEQNVDWKKVTEKTKQAIALLY